MLVEAEDDVGELLRGQVGSGVAYTWPGFPAPLLLPELLLCPAGCPVWPVS